MSKKIIMLPKNNYHYTLTTFLMILIASLGFTLRDNRKKNFYVPIGVIGIYLTCERKYNRKTNRENILNKIKKFSRK